MASTTSAANRSRGGRLRYGKGNDLKTSNPLESTPCCRKVTGRNEEVPDLGVAEVGQRARRHRTLQLTPCVVGGRHSMQDSSADEATSTKRWGSQENPSAVALGELKGRKAAGARSPVPPVSEQEGLEDHGHALSKAQGHRVSS